MFYSPRRVALTEPNPAGPCEQLTEGSGGEAAGFPDPRQRDKEGRDHVVRAGRRRDTKAALHVHRRQDADVFAEGAVLTGGRGLPGCPAGKEATFAVQEDPRRADLQQRSSDRPACGARTFCAKC